MPDIPNKGRILRLISVEKVSMQMRERLIEGERC